MIRVWLAALCLAWSAPVLAQTTLVPFGATWKYLDDGSDQGTAWQAPAFDDASWASGAAELGYGDGDEVTTVNGGPVGNRFITTYFRHAFNVVDPSAFNAVDLQILRDDGAVVYLNDTEVYRTNMPGGAIDSSTTASSAVGSSSESTLHAQPVNPALLVAGTNVLAVEIHQAGPSSSDISLDFELVGDGAAILALERPPYLQMGTSDAATVRWRTNLFAETVVRYGTIPSQLTQTATIPGLRLEHEVRLTGFAPSERVYYSVGTSVDTLAGGDLDHFFVTSPPAGQRTPFRIWVVGDSGQCSLTNQGCIDVFLVREAYLTFAGSDIADVWLMLGDNAYNSGTDQEYTDGVFQPFTTVLRNTMLWPVPGNHEFGASDSPTQSGPYYDAFTVPTQAEAGGEMSGTEAYYSFDYANVHFIALDSHDTSRSPTGAMYTWLESDLMATQQEWVIVYWHHPPYTKGSHDSDLEGHLGEMRTVFVDLLEDHGVDLQLSGHSHSYERSILLDGHYGLSSTYDENLHAVDPGDGDPDGDGAYRKPTLGTSPHEGAVYSVVGSSSKNTGGLTVHPVMASAINFEGSLVVDIDGPVLDGRFIDRNAVTGDRFQIVKGPTPTVPALPTQLTVWLASGLVLGLLLVWTRGAPQTKRSTTHMEKP